MGILPKSQRRWVKQEKRIVRLMYRKGLIDMDINNLYWEAYTLSGKKYKSKHSSKKYVEYLPEMYYAVADYWNEVDEISLVDSFIEHRTWMGIPMDQWGRLSGCLMEDVTEMSDFKYQGRQWLIKWLSKQPTVRCDHKINKILKVQER